MKDLKQVILQVVTENYKDDLEEMGAKLHPDHVEFETNTGTMKVSSGGVDVDNSGYNHHFSHGDMHNLYAGRNTKGFKKDEDGWFTNNNEEVTHDMHPEMYYTAVKHLAKL